MDTYRTPLDVWAAAERVKAAEGNRELCVMTFAARTFEALWQRDRRTLAKLGGFDPPEDDEDGDGEQDTGDPGALTVPPLDAVDPPDFSLPIPYTLGADVPSTVAEVRS